MLEEIFLKIRDQKSVWNIQHRKKWILFTTALTLKGSSSSKKMNRSKTAHRICRLAQCQHFHTERNFFENQNSSLSHVSLMSAFYCFCVYFFFAENIINMKNSPAQKNLCRYLRFSWKKFIAPFFHYVHV
jgi:hypothetical protein